MVKKDFLWREGGEGKNKMKEGRGKPVNVNVLLEKDFPQIKVNQLFMCCVPHEVERKSDQSLLYH